MKKLLISLVLISLMALAISRRSVGPPVHRCGGTLLCDMWCDMTQCFFLGLYGLCNLENNCQCECYDVHNLDDYTDSI